MDDIAMKIQKIRHLSTAALISVALLGMVGCASQPQVPPPIERISAEDLEKLSPPPIANVTLETLVLEAKQGKTADQLIAMIVDSQSRYDLTPEQTIAYNKQGLPIEVLNYIDEANNRAKQNAIAEEINKRQKAQVEKERQLARERDLARMQYYDPYWGMYYGRPWFGPYGPAPFSLHYRRMGPRFGWGLGYGW
jgi:hypothetical protein